VHLPPSWSEHLGTLAVAPQTRWVSSDAAPPRRLVLVQCQGGPTQRQQPGFRCRPCFFPSVRKKIFFRARENKQLHVVAHRPLGCTGQSAQCQPHSGPAQVLTAHSRLELDRVSLRTNPAQSRIPNQTSGTRPTRCPSSDADSPWVGARSSVTADQSTDGPDPDFFFFARAPKKFFSIARKTRTPKST
jgi:hypothetical protein